MAQDRGHGGSLQPARREPSGARDPRPPRRRSTQRPHGGIHAVDLCNVRRSPATGKRRARRAAQAGPGAQVRRESHEALCSVKQKSFTAEDAKESYEFISYLLAALASLAVGLFFSS